MRRVMRSEWTKFRSVRSWVVATVAGAILTIAATNYFATVSSTNANEGPQHVDQFHFVHQSLTGDGSVVARVSGQEDSHEWAKAGVMVKQSAASGADYVALFVTPRHGVRLQSNFALDIAASDAATPRWLRLTRSGAQVSAHESADGTQWTRVGEVTLDGLPETIEAGVFVTSPGVFTVEREFGSTRTGTEPTLGRATFDHVSLTSADGTPAPGEWRGEDIAPPPDVLAWGGEPQLPGSTMVDGSSVVVMGSGDIAPRQWGDNDVILDSLAGVLICLMVVIVVSVLFITSEFRKGLIRTTFTATPRRAPALLAKALVIGAVTFVIGLVAATGSYALARPAYAANGFTAPSYPVLPLHHPTVLRAVFGAALMLALVAVLAVSLGAILRRSAAAIAVLVAALIVPPILQSALPLEAALWLGRATPTAGLAIMQTRPRWDTAIGPLAGLGVLAGYALLALTIAMWRIGRRDA